MLDSLLKKQWCTKNLNRKKDIDMDYIKTFKGYSQRLIAEDYERNNCL